MAEHKGRIDEWRRSRSEEFVHLCSEYSSVGELLEGQRSENSANTAAHINLGASVIAGESTAWPDNVRGDDHVRRETFGRSAAIRKLSEQAETCDRHVGRYVRLLGITYCIIEV